MTRPPLIQITLADGTRLIQDTLAGGVLGTAANPMTREQVVAKCRDLMAPVLGATTTTRLIDRVLALEKTGNIRELRPLLQVASRGGAPKLSEYPKREVTVTVPALPSLITVRLKPDTVHGPPPKKLLPQAPRRWCDSRVRSRGSGALTKPAEYARALLGVVGGGTGITDRRVRLSACDRRGWRVCARWR